MDFQGNALLIGLFVSAGGLIMTAFGLIVAGRQLRASNEQVLVSQRIAQGEFLLHLDQIFRYHDKVHRKLRPGGEWGKEGCSDLHLMIMNPGATSRVTWDCLKGLKCWWIIELLI